MESEAVDEQKIDKCKRCLHEHERELGCLFCQEYRKQYSKTYKHPRLEQRKASKRANFLKKYWPGSTPEQAVTNYNALFALQDGKCVGCDRHQMEFKQALCVDHDHTTKVVRGLLCPGCNRSLGYVKESIKTLTNLVSYLEKQNDK
jgi:hypothetical protein